MALLGVATNFSWKKADGEWGSGVDYHRVVVFGKLAQQVGEYMQKGSRVFVEGVLKTRSWTDAGGQKQWMTEIQASSVVFMDMAKKADGGAVEEVSDVNGGEELPVDVQEVDLW